MTEAQRRRLFFVYRTPSSVDYLDVFSSVAKAIEWAVKNAGSQWTVRGFGQEFNAQLGGVTSN